MTPDHDPDRVEFAALLRGKRLAAGLTQAELAGRAGVGVRTVRDLERGRSARPHRTTVDLLAAALELAGRDREAFAAAARAPRRPTGRPPVAASEPGGAGAPAGRQQSHAAPGYADLSRWRATSDRCPSRALPLPPPGELIGRDRDLAELVELLARRDAAAPRLVTLVGIAGAGKTRLAAAVAHRGHPAGGALAITVGEFATAAELLAAARSPRRERAALRPAGPPPLLLIDGIERAPAAVVEALRQLHAARPGLRVLATGRHPLGIAGERVWPVPPLELPPAEVVADPAAVARFPAAELFLVRLRQARSAPPDPTETAALVGLVRPARRAAARHRVRGGARPDPAGRRDSQPVRPPSARPRRVRAGPVRRRRHAPGGGRRELPAAHPGRAGRAAPALRAPGPLVRGARGGAARRGAAADRR